MPDNGPSFLTDENPEPALMTPEPEAPAPAPEPQPEPVKGEEIATPPVAQEEAKAVPLVALLDERDKRKQAERELEELKRWRAEQEARANPPQKPDFFTDPDSALAAVQQQAVAAAVNTKLQVSRFHAERDFGADTVAEAYAFFDRNPQLSRDLINHPSPFHAAVQVYKRHKVLEQMGDDPDKWIEEQVKARLPQAPVQTPPTPPPSMAASPASGSPQRPPTSGFDALFQRE